MPTVVSTIAMPTRRAAGPDPDRPPACPVCQRRLVILASRSRRDATGVPVRAQLWGCPSGHATADYAGGVFGPVELLPDL